MKVILLKDEPKLGKKGDLVEVNDGYARNYVLPKKIGIEATAANMNDFKLHKANEAKVAAKQLADAKALAEELDSKSVTVKIKAGTGGRAFGSATSKEIAAAAKEQLGLDIDKKKIVLAEPLKNFGSYDVTIKLHQQVTGKLKVHVVEG